MIELTQGDILFADTEALVNTVNCVGVMGRGMALQFRKAYPVNFKIYEAACKRHEVLPGKMLVFETGLLTGPRYTVNFPTKRHWKGTEALVNTVNCVGVMGRGMALQFRKAYPAHFKIYEDACKRHEVLPGKMLVFETGLLTGPRYIVNFPTKRHWKGKSRSDEIDAGLPALVEEIRKRDIRSVAV